MYSYSNMQIDRKKEFERFCDEVRKEELKRFSNPLLGVLVKGFKIRGGFREREFKNGDYCEVLKNIDLKCDYIEKIEKKNGSYKWILKDPPIWLFYHTLMYTIKKFEEGRDCSLLIYYDHLYNWIIDRENKYNLLLLFVKACQLMINSDKIIIDLDCAWPLGFRKKLMFSCKVPSGVRVGVYMIIPPFVSKFVSKRIFDGIDLTNVYDGLI